MKESFQEDANPVGITEKFRETRLVEPTFQKALRAGCAEAAPGAHVQGHQDKAQGRGAVGGGLPRTVASELATGPFTTPLPCWAAEGPWVPRLKLKERSPHRAVTREPLTPAMYRDPPSHGAIPRPSLLDGPTAPSSIRGSETDAERRGPLMNGCWDAGTGPHGRGQDGKQPHKQRCHLRIGNCNTQGHGIDRINKRRL